VVTGDECTHGYLFFIAFLRGSGVRPDQMIKHQRALGVGEVLELAYMKRSTTNIYVRDCNTGSTSPKIKGSETRRRVFLRERGKKVPPSLRHREEHEFQEA
jgi:hypothetical protein